jgi:hypothetical protein
MTGRFLDGVIWNALKHLFLSGLDALRSPLAIPGEEGCDKSGIRKFWLGFQAYLLC